MMLQDWTVYFCRNSTLLLQELVHYFPGSSELNFHQKFLNFHQNFKIFSQKIINQTFNGFILTFPEQGGTKRIVHRKFLIISWWMVKGETPFAVFIIKNDRFLQEYCWNRSFFMQGIWNTLYAKLNNILKFSVRIFVADEMA